ncbi:MAG: endo-1,4-beta-xylanase Z [Rikenellaceae bacterium]|nr:endo-1,4-beta-xylanase Z [Rikenellaceae bacterium]
MKRLMLLAIALVVAVGVSAQSRLIECKMESKLLGAVKEYSIYLPDGYDKSDRSYPVLYLLHGANGTHTSWPTSGNAKRIIDGVIKEGRSVPMVIVMPDASGEGKDFNGLNFGYFDQTNWPYERHFIEEFIPYIESTYRIKADKRTRAIAGLSMGGYGTMFYTMRHPELFSSACPISARMSGTPYNKNRSYTDEYITTLDSLAGVKIAQSLSDEQIAALRQVRLRVDCGDDDYLFDGNVDFVRALRSHKIPVEFRVRDGGHSWIYWQTALPDILTYVSIGFME